jgi:hypothetical protein
MYRDTGGSWFMSAGADALEDRGSVGAEALKSAILGTWN